MIIILNEIHIWAISVFKIVLKDSTMKVANCYEGMDGDPVSQERLKVVVKKLL